jgi:hypothetical protein
VIPGSFVLVAVLVSNGPFFPTSIVPAVPHADTRRCIVGSQWVVTTASAVATARPSGGRIHVRIADTDHTVEQIVYHPKWNGGLKYDVTLLKLADRVPSFPMLPPPGEFPVNVERVAQRALVHRQWVSQTIGPSPVWDESKPLLAGKESALLTRVRSLMDAWAGRTSND